jgi:hypothetical protein
MGTGWGKRGRSQGIGGEYFQVWKEEEEEEEEQPLGSWVLCKLTLKADKSNAERKWGMGKGKCENDNREALEAAGGGIFCGVRCASGWMN